MIVADTGPIIAFARIRRLDILRSVASEVAIPPAVYRELISAGPGRPDYEAIEDSPWIRQHEVSRLLIAPTLHDGEREAIALALELGLPVLMDEQRGRRLAMRHHIVVIGSLGMLAMAKQQGIIPEVRPIIEELLASGYWISREIIDNFSQLVGE